MIDFKNVEGNLIENFKDGNGAVLMKKVDDGKVKILELTLKKGASIGLHKHTDNFEVMLVQKGIATFIIDGKQEIVKASEVHYCPNNSSHTLVNNYDEDLVLFAIVAQ